MGGAPRGNKNTTGVGLYALSRPDSYRDKTVGPQLKRDCCQKQPFA